LQQTSEKRSVRRRRKTFVKNSVEQEKIQNVYETWRRGKTSCYARVENVLKTHEQI